MVDVRCECGKELKVSERLVGRCAACAGCRRTLRFVAADGADPGRFDARLVLKAGPTKRAGEVILLGGRGAISVGKLPDQHVPLPGAAVSRRHCRLVRGDDGWRVEDLNSTNGLYVNGARAAAQRLRSGDRLRIGDFEFAFHDDAAAAAAEDDDLLVLEEIDDGGYDLAEVAEPAAPVAPTRLPRPTAPGAAAGGNSGGGGGLSALLDAPTLPAQGIGAVCPSCERSLKPGAKICVACGINVESGRPILVAKGTDENLLHANAEGSIRWISWVVPFGLYPIASEAYGSHRPWTTRAIFVVTLLASLAFLAGAIATGEALPPGSGFMLWWGDAGAAMGDELALLSELGLYETREFAWYQLLTHALLHADLLHLGGNMVFLMVFGSRVNALLGNVATAVIYPVLALLAAAAHMASTADEFPVPMLGASGAIMGLAGMYFVLFPVHKVYMAIWLRLGLLTGFKLLLKVWAVRGFWVVLFYIAFDVVATLLGAEDGVAHWAHLGGFGAGMFVAVALLVSRQFNARGGDLLSVVLGRHAWALLGKPSRWSDAAAEAPRAAAAA